MKVIKFIFKNVLFPASFLYMIFDLIVYTIDYIETRNMVTEVASTPKLFMLLLIYAYFIIVALANNIFKSEHSLSTKLIIHYLSVLIPPMVYCGFRNNRALPTTFFLITVLYAVIAAIIILITKLVKRKKDDHIEYESKFDG